MSGFKALLSLVQGSVVGTWERKCGREPVAPEALAHRGSHVSSETTQPTSQKETWMVVLREGQLVASETVHPGIVCTLSFQTPGP